MPPAFATIKNTKEFNAVQFGPGNTFAVMQTPPDFQLNEFAISADGKLLAMGWGSGKIDLWDVPRKKRIADFKSEVGAPGAMKFNAAGDQLFVSGRGGKLVFLGLPKGKKLRDFTIPLGKHNFDVHEVVLEPRGKWVAVADEETSRVLDLTKDPPVQVGDLKDAYSLDVTQDASELWTVNRSEIAKFRTDTWERTGHWPLKSPPEATASPRLRTGIAEDGATIIAVPSSTGLVFYRAPDMAGTFATDRKTIAVAYAAASKTFINIGPGVGLLNSRGVATCRRASQGWSGYDISNDGQWLAISVSNVVSVWRVEDLLRDCEAKP
jgi:hypothetical protein